MINLQQTSSTPGKYPDCPFGTSGNCCKNIVGGIDESNCGSNSQAPQNQQTSSDSQVQQNQQTEDQNNEVETVTETSDKILKTIKKKNWF